jgi:hypothetical protein
LGVGKTDLTTFIVPETMHERVEVTAVRTPVPSLFCPVARALRWMSCF